MINISYAITVNNELEEFQTLINKILTVLTHDDEIIIIQDNNQADKRCDDIKKIIVKLQTKFNNIYYDNTASLNNNFSYFKNYMIEKCNKDWIVHFDADEYPNQYLLENIKKIIELNLKLNVDLFWVPRINTVIGITDEYIKKANWHLDKNGWINFPDYQQRIWKNKKSIKWEGIVHERLVNATKQSFLPKEELYSYYHIKTFNKQKQQNEFYATIGK